MPVSGLLRRLRQDGAFRGGVAHVENFGRKEPAFGVPAHALHPLLQEYLDAKGIRLYRHQCQAIDALSIGRHAILATGTSSGKTLAFNLPVFDRLLRNPASRALYIYPAKALANDQLKAIREIESFTGAPSEAAVYDGDTPSSKRPAIRERSAIVLTNPFELHQVLPWHPRWSGFFSHLDFVVIDEAHRYRGVFGSHVALLLRRLRRICSFYGSFPAFVVSSATLANPEEFAHALTGLDFTVCAADGSPRGERHFVLYNPFGRGRRGSAHTAAKDLLLSCVGEGLQTLCFTSSRRMAELIARWAREEAGTRGEGHGDLIAPYRAGYLPEERRRIEDRLKRGELRGIVSTNALEMGIDIGSLDAVILCGFPGTLVSTWQQVGRAGRRSRESVAILVAFENPLDQYFMHHPEAFFSRSSEHAILDSSNPYILAGHLLCAASELPVSPDRDGEYFGRETAHAVLELAGSGLLRETGRGWVYTGKGRATEAVSLDSLSSESFRILCEGRVLETMDRAQAYREAHRGAVLLHGGETYLVQEMSLEERAIRVRKAEVEYHTEAVKRSSLEVLRERSSARYRDFGLSFGDVRVEEEYFAYRIVQGGEVIRTEPLHLPPLRFDTHAFWLTVPSASLEEVERTGCDPAGGLHGMEHAAIGIMPFHVLCDRWDIGGLSTLYHPSTDAATVFVYDGCEGGVGLCEKAHGIAGEIFATALELVSSCGCDAGCPSCIFSPKCGNDNRPLDKRGTAMLLASACEAIPPSPRPGVTE